MEYTKGTVIGCGKDGFSITIADLYAKVQQDLISQPNLYEALKALLVTINRTDIKFGDRVEMLAERAIAKAEGR